MGGATGSDDFGGSIFGGSTFVSIFLFSSGT